MISTGLDMPDHVGGYRVERRIGGGTTSVVYAAVEESTGRPVALKMIATDLADDPDASQRFQREASVTARLLHHNIVRVLDIGEDAGRAYIVMERLEGLPLKEYLRRPDAHEFPVQLSLITQLLQGLRAAHGHDVVHRDIKPNNLFVEHGGTLKILDFGLARLQASTLTASGQILGTPDFMSPEQAEGRVVDVRSDIFSAAAVGYFIVTGRAPFASPGLRDTLQAILTSPPAPMTDADAPEPLRRVLLHGLEKNPLARYQHCSDMLVDLQDIHRSLVLPASAAPVATTTAGAGWL